LERMRTLLNFCGCQLPDAHLLIVATNRSDAVKALSIYRKRWMIECMFADCKSRRLNLADTHLTNPKKLDTLLFIVALAATWSSRCASVLKERTGIPKKIRKKAGKVMVPNRSRYSPEMNTLQT